MGKTYRRDNESSWKWEKEQARRKEKRDKRDIKIESEGDFVKKERGHREKYED